MEKREVLNPPAITIDIVDLDGNKKTLMGKRITRKNINEYSQMVEDSLKKPLEDQLVFQMAWIYGGTENDYDNYDIRAIKKAVTFFSEQLTNPT